MSHAINFKEKFDKFSNHCSPKVIAEMNDYQFKLAKIKDEFVWHSHSDTDEVFVIMKGSMLMRLRDGDIELNEGEMFVVPKGIEHQPFAEEECHIMIIEPRGVVNTGDSDSELTAQNDVWI